MDEKILVMCNMEYFLLHIKFIVITYTVSQYVTQSLGMIVEPQMTIKYLIRAQAN